ncbi:MAG: glucuronyl esterase domain-containing protein [Candidatus Corynebacterium faecigallinarum]
MNYLQLGPDSPDLYSAGLFPLFRPSNSTSWGGIGMWAWYLQRMLDVLRVERLGSVHIAFGHSRLGKTAIWAAAQDPRFSAVVSNDSGCMGASLSVSPGVETPAVLARVRPYWFNDDFVDGVLAGRELPSQDQLLSSIPPRVVYVASAEEDVGADPRGEEMSVERVRAAHPDAAVGYHCRPGPHDVQDVDWQHYLDFFDTVLPNRRGRAPRER